jgi:molybdenum cofactor cytidylyltransferase
MCEGIGLFPAGCIEYSAGAMRSIDSITPIILAAGDSKRMGYPKALLPIGDTTFLGRILGTIRSVGLTSPLVVLGRAAALIRPAIQKWPVRIIVNPDPDRGQLSSIQLGISSLDANAQACMLWPADQPAVSEEMVSDLVRLYLHSQHLMAFPKFGGKRGHPAIFHQALFREFLAVPLEEGPKKMISGYQEDIAELPTDESAVIHDIDTPWDYELLTGESLESALARRGKAETGNSEP